MPGVKTGLRMHAPGYTDPDIVFEDVGSGLKLVQHYNRVGFVEEDEGDDEPGGQGDDGIDVEIEDEDDIPLSVLMASYRSKKGLS